jgi:hypothetical protein
LDRVLCWPRAGLGLWSSYLWLPHSWITGAYHNVLNTCWDGSLITFCLGWPELWTSWALPLSNWGYRHEPLHWLNLFFFF